MQIGALNATTAGGLRLLLDRIFRSPEAHVAQELSCFLYPVSSSVVSALNRQRFVLEHPEYLSVGAPDIRACAGRSGPWRRRPASARGMEATRPLRSGSSHARTQATRQRAALRHTAI